MDANEAHRIVTGYPADIHEACDALLALADALAAAVENTTYSIDRDMDGYFYRIKCADWDEILGEARTYRAAGRE